MKFLAVNLPISYETFVSSYANAGGKVHTPLFSRMILPFAVRDLSEKVTYRTLHTALNCR